MPDADAVPGERGRSRSQTVSLVIVALIAVLAGILIGRISDREQSSTPEPGSVDVGFAQDMSVHHAQAVEMSGLALTRSGAPEIRSLAYDVVTSQQSQIGTMQGWLRMWNRPAIDAETSMRWMPPTGEGHSMGSAPTEPAAARMPGMASPDELRTLRQASGTEFDALYLQLLLRHHEGGIPMAEYARGNAVTAIVREFADRVAQTQTAESQSLRQLLEARGRPPLPLDQPHR
ncbi:DUF305 domain-containing protein [Nocardia cyriacigeorgica]|uniref:DUF305 domain-containing protein n=1 Tax=Nocardia cyriacigeorgica TaxID=135487 RepID=A0A5R8PD70_9NOCA|nr:DUF305 domain-containing protein [Nocardia cyriacigeorgica]